MRLSKLWRQFFLQDFYQREPLPWEAGFLAGKSFFVISPPQRFTNLPFA